MLKLYIELIYFLISNVNKTKIYTYKYIENQYVMDL